MTFGPLFVLMPAGFLRADRRLRLLAVASLPAMAAFVYVQQPDRALWNFHFVAIPIAILALEALPDRLCWLFIAAFGVANLKLGDSQPIAVSWSEARCSSCRWRSRRWPWRLRRVDVAPKSSGRRRREPVAPERRWRCSRSKRWPSRSSYSR